MKNQTKQFESEIYFERNNYKRSPKWIIMIFLFFCFRSQIFAQCITITKDYNFTLVGSNIFTVPVGIHSLTVECWGSGGSGGEWTRLGSPNFSGGGGGGGAYSRSNLTVIPGAFINLYVGRYVYNGNTGEDSWFGSQTTLLAKGGEGGATASSFSGGMGGRSYSGIGSVKFSGGDGGAFSGSFDPTKDASAGGGGSSASSISDGVNGQDGQVDADGGLGGILINAGNGGKGSCGGCLPESGYYPGGGGGGSGSRGNNNPGASASGRVIVTYILPSAPGNPTAVAGPFINAQENGHFTVSVPALSITGAVVGDVINLYQDGNVILSHTLINADLISNYSFTNVSLTGVDGTKSLTVSVTNAAGNVGVSNATALSLTLDTTPPTITSIITVSTTNTWSTTKGTSASSAAFSITFSETVTGVAASDFTVSTTGSLVANVGTVSGNGKTYTATVNFVSGTGTAKLIYPDLNDAVIDAAGNPTGGTGVGNGIFNSSQMYTKVLPEPSGSVGNLRVIAQQATSVTILWNDAVSPSVQATHYLVMLKKTSSSFPAVTDGIIFNDDNDFADGVLKQNIPYESTFTTAQVTFTGLTSTSITPYDVIVYPYTLAANYSSDNIDYKTTNPLTLITPIAPADPIATVANAISSTSFTANWNASTGATNYYLDISTVNNFTSFVSGYNNLDVGSVTGGYIISNLNPNTTYYYRITAGNLAGLSGHSNTITAVTLLPTPVSTAATNITITGFSANWDAVPGALSYKLDISKDDFTTFVSGFNDLTVSGTSLLITGLSPNTTYKYRVRAISTSSVSASSNVISAITLFLKINQSISLLPLPDLTLSGSSLVVTLSGLASSNLPLDYSLTSTPTGIASLSGNLLTISNIGKITVTALQPGNDNYLSASQVSASFDVFTPAGSSVNPTITGINILEEIAFIQIFPNPNTGTFQIIIPLGKQLHGELINSLGQSIKQIELKEETTEVNGLKNGLYLLRVGKYVKKILVE